MRRYIPQEQHAKAVGFDNESTEAVAP